MSTPAAALPAEPVAPVAETPAAPVAAAPVVPAPQKPGIAATLAGVLAAARDRVNAGTELAAARAQVATLASERDTARGEVKDRDAQLSTLNSQLSGIAAHFGLKPAELAGKAAAEITALIDARINAAALDQVASMGLPTAALPAATTSTSAQTLDDVQAELAACTDPVRAGQLAAQANDLRDRAWGLKK